jgi:DNA-binding transcriptional MerR regulator
LLLVRNIRELLAIGFTISDVRTFLRYLSRDLPPVFADTGSCTEAMRVADERLTVLRERIGALISLHDSLAARLDQPSFGSSTVVPTTHG